MIWAKIQRICGWMFIAAAYLAFFAGIAKSTTLKELTIYLMLFFAIFAVGGLMIEDSKVKS